MSFGAKLKPELENFLKVIFSKPGYYGKPMSESIKKLVELEIRADGAGILVPYWFGVVQKGRGPRLSNKNHNLVKKIYAWMQKNNKFTSRTAAGKANEAKQMTWYINKYGTKQFNFGNPIYRDIYDTARKQLIKDVEARYSLELDKITMQIL